ncbi:MAG: magnesium/cobalt transporter CorA [Syntrophomonas sp.]
MPAEGNYSSTTMTRFYNPPGTPPGTLINRHSGTDSTTIIKMICYSENSFDEKIMPSIEDCWCDEKAGTISWINIEGCPSPELLELLGKHYKLHPLSLEDVLNIGQHSKLELYDNYYFMQMYLLPENEEPAPQQVSIFVGPHYVITLLEKENLVFEMLRNHLRTGKSIIRKMGTDFLAYSICDAIIDLFFPAVEKLRTQLDVLEDTVFSGSETGVPEKIHNIKRKLLLMRKIVWSAQEVIGGLQSQGEDLVSRPTLAYLRDAYSHTVQLIHVIDNCREISSGMMESYLSQISNQMNQVIKVLTLIATIFIPLTFIAGIYGMNFNPHAGPLNMPELNWPYGYVTVCFVMLLIALGMIIVFHRKKWL